jgi:hypothetical protein
LPQFYAYGEAKQASNWSTLRLSIVVDGTVAAICTVLQRRILGLPVVTRINRGPMFLEPTPSQTVVRAVYRAVRRRFRPWRGGLALMAPALPATPESSALLQSLGFRLRTERGWGSGRVDLTPDLETIRAGFASTFRNRVKKAEASGAVVEILRDHAGYDWMIDRHIENMADKGFSAADRTFLDALRDADPSNVMVFRVLHDGCAVAGMSIVRFGTHCEYHIGWFGPAGRAVNAGNLLMWSIIVEMKRLGCTQFDVGGLSEGGYSQFKRTMRPEEYALCGEWLML